jgi:chromosome segregation protein
MYFAKLRLNGFKSFVEPTEFAIEPGLTGVVGPNGCGKSNLVEALRWVMGETRVKQLRGGEMEDVIFAGTTSRPSRDVAEVSLTIDNSSRKAPAPWNEFSEIQVARRIERGHGSNYAIAGRDVRQRDVQFFFADIASGAHSPALVSQGRIGAIINAKPTERRALLEEAAGITGLYSRRHEAELKLRAAEGNLARLDDVLTALDQQLQVLKKQARQAARYRNINNLIRRAEAGVLTWRWRRARAAQDEAAGRLAEAERGVAEFTQIAARAATVLAEAESVLPDRRKAEAEAAAAIQLLIIAREQLESEERNVRARLEDAGARLSQIAADRAREQAQVEDAERALAKLADERIGLKETAIAGAAEAEIRARELEAQRVDVEARDHDVARATEAVAAAETQRAALARKGAEIETQLVRLAARLGEIVGERRSIETEITAAAGAAQAAAQAMTQASQALDAARIRTDETESRRRAAQEEEAGARKALADAEAARARLAAEADGLRSALAQTSGEGFRPVLDDIAVDPGYEAALAAALGDDLDAPVDGAASRHWGAVRPHDDAPSLPHGSAPLSDFVRAPAALARRLAQVGVVDDSVGDELATQLIQGQRLVSRSGALWRWDGFRIKAGTKVAAAARLAQRNRLSELTGVLAVAEAVALGARARLVSAEAGMQDAQRDEADARMALRQAQSAQAGAERSLADETQRATQRAARLAAIEKQQANFVADEAELRSTAGETAQLLADQPDPTVLREALLNDRAALTEARALLMDFEGAMRRLDREAHARGERERAIAYEDQAWGQRREAAARQLEILVERAAQTESERARLAARPDEITAERNALAEHIIAAEAARRAASDALAAAETAAATALRASKAADEDVYNARESRVRAEADSQHSEQALAELAARIRERLDCAPDETLALTGADAIEELSALEQLEARLERLVTERETVGPVNLRAEEEADALNQQVESMRAERDDLTRAIAKLRHGIGQLNREGRERLLAAFETVNKQFSELFAKLFGGGRAHLALSPQKTREDGTVDDDPLEAGLEVMASPPGKKLQSLSLLSGGEQALTALALLFAVFQTNPAPVCVLDEVDAPLDDANVDRFCRLLEMIARDTSTRFVVVTHHRMTMSRMDRLFGVTMAERGVSQLVSVDLARAVQMRATA